MSDDGKVSWPGEVSENEVGPPHGIHNPKYGVLIPRQFLDLNEKGREYMWENYFKLQFEAIEKLLKERGQPE